MKEKPTSISRAGAIAWMTTVQYFIVQVIVASMFTPSYGWGANTISDLGNTDCGFYGSKMVCSPQHGLMNVSFVVLGIAMMFGSLLLVKQYGRGFFAHLGFYLMTIAGFGSILVGFAPENTIAFLHVLGASLPFILGNISLIVLGLSVKQLPLAVRRLGVIFGIVSLAALLLFFWHHYLGIGEGGMERIVAYPQTIWLIIVGTYVIFSKPRHQKAT